MIFGVGLEGDFGIAVGAFEVEPEDFDSQVGLLVTDFHTHVEFGSDVEVVSTGVAPQRHRQHVSHHHQLVFPPSSLYDTFVVEVFREVLYQHLALSH